MTLLYMEGFDGYGDIADLYADPRYLRVTDGTDPTFTTGRSGSGQAIQFTATEDLWIRLPQDSSDTIIVGFGFKKGTGSSALDFMVFYADSANVDTYDTFTVYTSSSDTLAVRRDGTVILETGTLTDNTWYYIEFKLFLDNSVGTGELWVDGTSVDTFAGDTVGSSAGAYVNLVEIASISSLVPIDLDDFYIADDTGSDVTDVVGPVSIELLAPDGAGSSTQFTPSTGSNYQNVDDASPDDDTTYNSSSTATHKDLFSVADVSTSSITVHAVQVSMVVQKQEGGNRSLRTKVLSSATEGNGTTVGAPVGSYRKQSDIFALDPNGSIAWTESAVNAMEIGYEVVS